MQQPFVSHLIVNPRFDGSIALALNLLPLLSVKKWLPLQSINIPNELYTTNVPFVMEALKKTDLAMMPSSLGVAIGCSGWSP